MKTTTICINVTQDDVQAMVDNFVHLNNTVAKQAEQNPKARRLFENSAAMLLKIVEAHPDPEALKAATNRPPDYDPLTD